MATQDDTNFNVLATDRSLPAPTGQNSYIAQRGSRYGERYALSLPGERHAIALEGGYFVAHNNTNDASSTLVGHAAPLVADADATMTKPFLHCMMPSGSDKLAFLDFVEIEVVTAGANGSSACWAAQLDTGTTRISSGSPETLTTVNVNMRSSRSPLLVSKAGAITASAESSSARLLGWGQHRKSIEIAGDKYLFLFGRSSRAGSGIATIAHHVAECGPVVLGETDQFLLAMYAATLQDAAGVYKIRMGWWER